jgi:predicted permease
MGRWRAVWERVRAVVSRKTVERELDDELRFHLEMETEQGVRRGLSVDEARRLALVKFGGVERFREESLGVRGLLAWESLLRDARLSIRFLRRSPTFTVATVGTLALALGATTAVYSVVDAVLLRPSPFPDSDRVVMVWETDRASGTMHEPASWPDVVDFAERSQTLASVGSMMGLPARVAGPEGVERFTGLVVTPGFFESLGVEPIAGRLPADPDWTSGTAVLLGEDYWRERLGADPTVVGRTINVNDAPVEVLGVLPREADLGVGQIHDRSDYNAGFAGGDVAVWFPSRPDPEVNRRENHPFLTIGRLTADTDVEAAQQELLAIAADLEATYEVNENRSVNLETYDEVVFGSVRAALRVLMGSVLLVLLVGCANVANLLLARAVTRNREVSVRRALGASAGQLRRQFLVEAVVLATIGTGLGIVLAFGMLDVLLAVAPPEIPRLSDTRLHGGVLGLAAGAGALIALAFGLLPALYSGAVDVQQALKAQPGRRATEGRRTRSFRSALIVGEVALAVTLVVGAGVLLRSFWSLSRVDPGFQTAQIVTAQYQLPASRYRGQPTPEWPNYPETNGFHAALLDRVRALPGVEAAAVSAFHPLEAGFTNSFVIMGREAEFGSYPEIRIRYASPGYVETLGVSLLAGRAIEESDVAGAPMAIMINRTAAERYFPGADPLGQQLRWWGFVRQIVGVIEDERFLGLDTDPVPAAYVPMAQGAQAQATLVVRTSTDPALLVASLRSTLRELDPEVPLFGAGTLEQTVVESLASPRFTARLVALFGGVALLLALIGVHGVLSYSVAQRVPEMGIRMALGAERSSVTRAVVGEGLRLGLAGAALGLIGAFAASRLLESLLFGVAATDPATYAVVLVAVLLAALLASLLPALRAARADPLSALRAD